MDKAAGIRPFFTAVGISAVVVAMVTTRTYPRQFLHLLGEAWHWHPPAAWIASAGIFLVPTLWVSRAVRAVAIVGFLLLVSLEIRADFREERENQAAMREILSEATGGSSYVYFEVSAAGGPYEVPITGVVTGNVSAQLFPRFVGDYPLHDVTAFYGCTAHTFKLLGNLYPPSSGRSMLGLILQWRPTDKAVDCSVTISASNRSFGQVFRFVREGSKWTWAWKFGWDRYPAASAALATTLLRRTPLNLSLATASHSP